MTHHIIDIDILEGSDRHFGITTPSAVPVGAEAHEAAVQPAIGQCFVAEARIEKMKVEYRQTALDLMNYSDQYMERNGITRKTEAESQA